MYNHAPADYRNPFKKLADGDFGDIKNDEDRIFYSDDVITAFVSSMCWPGNEGNVLIIPNEVYENLYDIPDEVLAHIQIFSKKVAIAMRKTYGCDGVSLRQHNEPAGDQEVWHYHLHVFPRYNGDDLYIRHNEKTPSNPEDHKMYAEKLRTYINQTES